MKINFLKRLFMALRYKGVGNNGLRKIERKIREIEFRKYKQEKKSAFSI